MGFAAREDSGAVRSRQHADFAGDVAQLPRIPTVDALAFEDQVANDAFFQGLESAGDLLGGILGLAVFRQELGGHALAQLANFVGAVVLAGRLLAFAELVEKALPKDFH